MPTKDHLLSIYDVRGVERWWRENGFDPQRLRRLWYLVFGEGRVMEEVLAELPAQIRTRLETCIELRPLVCIEARTSSLDRSAKLVLQTRDQLRIETVLICSASGRMSLCVSSQVGCAANCIFCATARMGLLRNLSAGEIIGQYVEARRWLGAAGRPIRNVVYMGMGEPLHNFEAVCESLQVLCDPRKCGISPRRILVSTVGVPEQMVRFAKRFPLVGLAVSLHSTVENQRRQWIPLARHCSLDRLREVLHIVNRLQQRPLMIEYLMVNGLNDSRHDALRLVEFLKGLWVHVNLIPYNPIDDGPSDFAPSPREVRNAFAAVLREAGYLTTIRYSQGADIRAACGQLAQVPGAASGLA
ncbi:MAG: putative RNA methyltransferase [Pirellulaceae bacterium]|nr:MAG: putative RNA methyltransferase [Pirellulaceae bacterium]